MRRHVVDVLLVLAIVGVVAVSLVVGSSRSGGGEGEKFGGTDALVAEQLAEQGHEPWFTPLFAPDSGEVESGLFALQAAAGAGVLGYCLGVLRGRRRSSPGGAGGAAARDLGAGSDSGAAGPSTPVSPTVDDPR